MEGYAILHHRVLQNTFLKTIISIAMHIGGLSVSLVLLWSVVFLDNYGLLFRCPELGFVTVFHQ